MPPYDPVVAGRCPGEMMQRQTERLLTVGGIVAAVCIGVSLYLLYGIAFA
jgi:hypothetical protein